MSNSKLATYTRLSPNYNTRNQKITKITIHHMAGNLTLDGCYNSVTSRGGSSNYAIDSSGKIGMFVPENRRAWTSNSPDNDYQAVTIEVANDQIGGDWHVSNKAMTSLINLCVDICKRNGIKKLNFTGNKSGNLTMHKWFAATACPGPYLESKFPYIAAQVNKKLSASAKPKLDTLGAKYGDRSLGILSFKMLLLIAYKLGMTKYKVGKDNGFGKGTKAAVNELLKKWGYAQNGIVGVKFVKRLHTEIEKRI